MERYPFEATMEKYDRLMRGESFRLSEFRNTHHCYVNLIDNLRQEKVTGQFTLPFNGETELVLNVVHPIQPTEREVRMQQRKEALSLIHGEGKIV